MEISGNHKVKSTAYPTGQVIDYQGLGMKPPVIKTSGELAKESLIREQQYKRKTTKK